jgi:hypothetical protein
MQYRRDSITVLWERAKCLMHKYIEEFGWKCFFEGDIVEFKKVSYN